MNAIASPAAGRAVPAASIFFLTWEEADRLVPYPFLYFWLARPGAEGPARRLEDLSRFDFVYNLHGGFVAHVASMPGGFAAGAIHRRALGSQFMPMQGHQGLLTPEEVERGLEGHLRVQPPAFWPRFLPATAGEDPATPDGDPADSLERYRALPWQSLRLERPLHADWMEPVYRLRKCDGRLEFLVGAQSGRVRHEVLDEPATITTHPFVS